MLAKLSFRNAKRQAHDYIIYFVTLTAIFSLIHGLNSLLFAEDDIFPLDDSTFILPMILISSLLFSISLWLTSYMTNFILKRRSKEISIYITLGMEPYQISKVFTLENFYISIFALILSFLCGSFVYQVLKAVSFNLLGKPYSLTFHFSLYPFVITFLYFLFTFLFSSFRSIKIIQKSQPQDWCKEHPVACSTYYHWKKALREEFLARMEAEQGHPILQTAVTVLFNQSEGCLRLLSATGLPSTKQFAHWHLACPHGSENPDSGAPNSRRSVHKSATVWR